MYVPLYVHHKQGYGIGLVHYQKSGWIFWLLVLSVYVGSTLQYYKVKKNISAAQTNSFAHFN